MKSRTKFRNLYAEYNGSNRVIFGGDHNDHSDCHDTCVLMHSITFCGIPEDYSDEQLIRVYEGDAGELPEIAALKGCLVLTEEINNRGEDPLMICDDLDGDLSYVMSVLQDNGAPLDFVEGNPDYNVYYIQELLMFPDFKNDHKLKSQLLNEIPDIIFKFLHVTPDVLAYYPAPLQREEEHEKDERYLALKNISDQKTQAAINKIFSFDEHDDEEPFGDRNVINFGEAYHLTAEDMELLYGDDSDPPYPEEDKDLDEFRFYEKNGFSEIGESRLLCNDVHDFGDIL